MVEWFLFLPQVRLSAADIADRARHAEASGFDGMAFIDHLEAPGLPDESIWEAMGIATWVAAKTERLRIGHLVLCDAFRHPAVLAKQAVTLSAASEGRFELGLGAGSWPAEFTRFDVGQQDPVARVEQLGRHLALIRQYWGDELQTPSSPRRRSNRSERIRYRWFWAAPGRRMMELVRSIRGLVESAGEPPRSVAQAGPGGGNGPDIDSADGGLRPVGQRPEPGA